jgi:hypothetical protein
MTLSEALDVVLGHSNWINPIYPFVVSGVYQSPYEAYSRLRTEYQEIVERLIGHIPTKDEE